MGIKLRVVQAPRTWKENLKDFGSLESQWTLRVDHFFGGGDYVTSVQDMVRFVIQACSSSQDTIDELTISGHGSNRHFRIGADAISTSTIDSFKDELAKLIPHFSSPATVFVEACNAGLDKELMRRFSGALGGVSVVARQELQSAFWGPSGPPVIADPRGTYTVPAPASGVSPPSLPPPGS